MDKHSQRRSLLFGLAAFLTLTGLLLVFIQRMDRDIFALVASVSPPAVILLLGLGVAYHLWEAAICQGIYQDKLPGFSLVNGLDVAYLNVFGNIATSAAASMPLQSYYLYRKGLMPGRGFSLVTMQYVFHKISILLYATVMLLLQWNWLRAEMAELFPYILFGCGVCLLIIAALALSCTWRRVRDLVLRILSHLPEQGKWGHRRQIWADNLNAIYKESRLLLQSHRSVARILVLNAFKLFTLYSVPCFCIRILGGPRVPLLKVQALASLMLLISNAIPNIAGIGATEFSFLLVFSRVFGDYAPAALLLYRLATYYFPFFLSCIWVLKLQRQLLHIFPEPEDLPSSANSSGTPPEARRDL